MDSCIPKHSLLMDEKVEKMLNKSARHKPAEQPASSLSPPHPSPGTKLQRLRITGLFGTGPHERCGWRICSRVQVKLRARTHQPPAHAAVPLCSPSQATKPQRLGTAGLENTGLEKFKMILIS